MHLRCILEFVGRPLDQEQAWAILYQCSCLLKRIWRQRQRDAQPIFPVELDFICLASDGSIDIQWQGNKENGLVAATRRRDVLASLGWAVYRGLDYSLAEDEARELQEDLEKVITRMTDNSGEDERDVDFDTVIEACRVRLPLLEQTDSHYKSVCRSLVTSAKKQSYKQNHDVQVAETYELQGKISAYDTLPDVVPNEWMVHWMHVVDQLKQGVELQKIILPEKPSNRKYELTPYEKLMESIKHPPQLNSALELAEISEEVQLQRSHPHLKPVSSRKLSSKPADVLTPMERLILEIQSPSTLKKTCTRIQSEPICAGMLHDHGCSMFTRRTSASPAPERSPMTVKRKLKARTLSEMFSDAEKESETSETVSSSRLTRTLTIEKIVSFDGEPVVRQQPAIDQENPGSSLQGDTEHLTSFHQTSILSVPTKSEGGDGGSEALGLASSVGQMHKTGEVSSKPAISLDELRHIREVLDRALLESLETEENALYLSLKMGKVGCWPYIVFIN
ncbi:protein spire homolog 1-like [Corticium candelabrum]|uniref:protein spire homolog 1-like n=1 Tax=Corticium candelabrum TaxID=121492 RepID=UPI002E264E45|nr:protein spire homolog 1-like [Corticium candelabrum]